MGDDQLQDTSGASQTIANPSQPASEQAPSEALADPISTPESATTDPNRPVSTILADSPNETTAPLAGSITDSPVATESASVAPIPDHIPVVVPTQPPADPISVAPEPVVLSIPSVSSVPSWPSEPTTGGSVQDSLPPDQPIQVQPEVPVSASSPQASPAPETPPQSAEIKPEPPQSTQPAPLADLDSQKSSFGDILVGTGEVKPQAEEPTINIAPIEPPKPTQPPQPPQSHSSPQPVTEATADFSSKRQQALETRRKNRDDHLAKILSLVSQKGKINNSDAVTLLRVSQSTATNYLHSLVKDGKIKKEGKAKATVYFI